MFGACAEAPGPHDLFSDNSPYDDLPEGPGGPWPIQKSIPGPSKRTIRSNPAAGDIRRFEISGAWMSKANSEIATENASLKDAAEKKRLVGLAKQTSIGLANLGVHYEMTSIANILRVAFSHQGHIDAATDDETRTAIEVLHAARQYDCSRVAELLGCQPARKPTFGPASAPAR